MKKPDEIKKGLVHCFTKTDCPGCPYGDMRSCGNDMGMDALAYIQQLETENHQLLTKIQQLERELAAHKWYNGEAVKEG